MSSTSPGQVTGEDGLSNITDNQLLSTDRDNLTSDRDNLTSYTAGETAERFAAAATDFSEDRNEMMPIYGSATELQQPEHSDHIASTTHSEEDIMASLKPMEMEDVSRMIQELIERKIAPPDRAIYLKHKYAKLYEKLLISKENELKLLNQAKANNRTLNDLRSELDTFEQTPPGAMAGQGGINEVGSLRDQLLRVTNDLELSRERINILSFEEKACEEEKNELLIEQTRLEKVQNSQLLIEELKRNLEELHAEETKAKTDISNLLTEIKKAMKTLRESEKEYDELIVREDKAKKLLVEAKTAPTNIIRHIDSMQKRIAEFSIKMSEKQKEFEDLLENYAKCKLFVEEKESTRKQLAREIELAVSNFDSKQRDNDKIEKESNFSLLTQGAYESDILLIDKQHRTITEESISEQEQYSRRQKTLESKSKQLKRTELAISRLYQEVDRLNSIKANYQLEIDSRLIPLAELETKIGELQRTSRISQADLEAQLVSQSATQHQISDINSKIQKSEELKTNMECQLKEHNQQLKIKIKVRDSDLERTHKLRHTYQHILDQIKTKSGVISEEAKCLKDLRRRKTYYSEVHQIVNTEAGAAIQMIQDCKQKASEMKDKAKTLDGELTDVKTRREENQMYLEKSKLKSIALKGFRDSQLIELNKTKMQLIYTRSRLEEQRGEIKKISGMINAAEGDMVKLRKRYEQMVQERNDRGIQLIERNEEVAVFYEKLNVQESILRQGNLNLQSREEELQLLKVEVKNLERQIDTSRKALPAAKQLENELVSLQIELSETHDRLRVLEKNVENPKENADRLVEVGSFPCQTQDELQGRLLKIEENLVRKEIQLREKELLLEHVSRITQKAQSRVDQTHNYTRDQGSRMNEVQNQLKDVTRKTMALLSELSMKKGSVLQLEREVNQREHLMYDSYIQMEQGLPPSEEIELGWERMLRAEQLQATQREEELDESSRVDLGGGLFTSAPRRPNAYIPDAEGELPVPKPYGSHAPFRPGEPGSNMRHIRKPVIKPIQF